MLHIIQIIDNANIAIFSFITSISNKILYPLKTLRDGSIDVINTCCTPNLLDVDTLSKGVERFKRGAHDPPNYLPFQRLLE